MSEKRCICLFGLKGSGKTYCSKIFAQLTNWDLLTTGDYFREQKQEYTNIEAFNKFKASLDRQNVLEVIFNYYFKKPLPEKIIIDSIRELDDWNFLVSTGFSISLVYIECEENKRLKRLIKRERVDDPIEVIKMKEFNRWEYNRFKPFFTYEYTSISTNVTHDKLQAKIKEVLKKIEAL